MWTRLAAAATDLLLPDACACCGTPGAACCPRCLGSLAPVPTPRCARCGHPFPVPVPRCRHCRGSVETAEQACVYGHAASRLVEALKDDRRRTVAPLLARVVATRCAPPPPDAVLVPVPLSHRRRRSRGFNQSALIAAGLGRLWGLSVADGVIVREREQAAQRGAGRGARMRQVAGAFAPVPGVVAPPVCWLVDDVHTTGATLAACAAALRRAGARRVGAVAFARVVRP